MNTFLELRSHDQFNTTIYGLSDRYRGIEGGRKVVFVDSDDIAGLGFADGDHVDLVSHWEGDSINRVAAEFRLVSYETPRGPRPIIQRRIRSYRSIPRQSAATRRLRSPTSSG